MAGVKGKSGRKISSPTPWGELYELAGGQSKIAAKLGVSKSTVGKWATDTHRIPELVKKELLRLCKYHGIEEGLEKLNS
ncbi:MAG: hypothetical protein AB8G05_00270 [Oligoflexales bacterium]